MAYRRELLQVGLYYKGTAMQFSIGNNVR